MSQAQTLANIYTAETESCPSVTNATADMYRFPFGTHQTDKDLGPSEDASTVQGDWANLQWYGFNDTRTKTTGLPVTCFLAGTFCTHTTGGDGVTITPLSGDTFLELQDSIVQWTLNGQDHKYFTVAHESSRTLMERLYAKVAKPGDGTVFTCALVEGEPYVAFTHDSHFNRWSVQQVQFELWSQ